MYHIQYFNRDPCFFGIKGQLVSKFVARMNEVSIFADGVRKLFNPCPDKLQVNRDVY